MIEFGQACPCLPEFHHQHQSHASRPPAPVSLPVCAVVPTPRGRNCPKEPPSPPCLTCAERERVTASNVASTMVAMLVNNPLADLLDLTSLRVLSCGGSPQSPAGGRLRGGAALRDVPPAWDNMRVPLLGTAASACAWGTSPQLDPHHGLPGVPGAPQWWCGPSRCLAASSSSPTA